MKKNKSLKVRNPYVTLVLILPLFIAMCHRQEKQSKRDDLDNKIAQANQEIIEAKDLRTANVPTKLRQTQARYNKTCDSLYNSADTLDLCVAQNDSLISHAFNEYAARVGRNFQISNFLSHNDVAVFQKHVAQLDTMDFIQENARKRILQNHGSMHDLMYFIEMFDLDSINTQLNEKLTWKFFCDTIDAEQFEISTLCFENEKLNHIIGLESNVLSRAWQQHYIQQQLIQNDSARAAELDNTTDSIQCIEINAKHDSINKQIMENFATTREYEPNFNIPEFDSVRTQYMHNDSIINAKNKTFMNLKKLEDTLLQYQQSVLKKRDSLIRERNEMEQ